MSIENHLLVVYTPILKHPLFKILVILDFSKKYVLELKESLLIMRDESKVERYVATLSIC